MISDSRIDLAVRSAEDAFWAEIAEQFPEASTGDLAPDISVELTETMKRAVKAWVDANVASKADI